MEDLLNQLIEETGSVFFAVTGITLPPIVIVIALFLAVAKGMKTLVKVASVSLVLYILWMMIQAGIIPIPFAL